MAKVSDLPPELIVNIMIKSATYSGSFQTAYALAITSKKHYSCFKNQGRQIFIAVMKYFLQPAPNSWIMSRFSISATIGNITITYDTPGGNAAQSSEDPFPVQIVFKKRNRGYGGPPELQTPACFAPLIAWLRGHTLATYYTPHNDKHNRQITLLTREFHIECKAGRGPWVDRYLECEEGSDYE